MNALTYDVSLVMQYFDCNVRAFQVQNRVGSTFAQDCFLLSFLSLSSGIQYLWKQLRSLVFTLFATQTALALAW